MATPTRAVPELRYLTAGKGIKAVWQEADGREARSASRLSVRSGRDRAMLGRVLCSLIAIVMRAFAPGGGASWPDPVMPFRAL